MSDNRDSKAYASLTAEKLGFYDEEVQTEAQKIFANSSYSALRDISCECHRGVITLQGRVPSFYLKQVAQQLVRAISHVEQIDNLLRVIDGNRIGSPNELN